MPGLLEVPRGVPAADREDGGDVFIFRALRHHRCADFTAGLLPAAREIAVEA